MNVSSSNIPRVFALFILDFTETLAVTGITGDLHPPVIPHNSSEGSNQNHRHQLGHQPKRKAL
jgi:hypothetical protein